ncbi:MAG: PAS domain-containing sensor histidine kinase, partial [Leptolyngbyaceae cyanobacterium MAG.088]|nr:PAS domain-containing sensor histidine kinase [Leptolyngbyaceae cyanobacterium MAG.088]
LVQRVKHLIAEQQECTQLERAIKNAPFPIMVHAEDGTVMQISSTWTELTGYTHTDIPTTKAWAQLAYGEEAARVLKQVMAKKYTLTSRWEEGEFKIQTKDGKHCLWQFSSAPLGPSPNGLRVVISMAVDITQRRQVEIEREELLHKLSIANHELEESNTQLQTTLTQLHTSQLQLIQHEKMSSLGNLVAGIAHEINNPLSFVGGNVNALHESFENLRDYVALFEKTYRPPQQVMVEARQDLDIEFLMSDIPKILQSMYLGCDRIRNISNSLRLFTRTDNEAKQDTDLHSILDNTLLILKYRLKANDVRPSIEVVRNYGTLQPVSCLPGQLSQVFMNIFANAIDMFDEMADSVSYQELETNRQKITIRTNVTDHQVQLGIRDNGQGIDKDTCQLIFERQFTTKPAGKGTGLGLAISKQIIEEKHNGYLSVQSTLNKGTEFIIQLPISENNAQD